MNTLLKLTLSSLLLFSLCFATGCEKSASDKAEDAVEDAADTVKDALN